MIIIKYFDKVCDIRLYINQVYPVVEVAFLVISTMLCGQNILNNIKDFGESNLDSLRQHLPKENSIPTRHNITAIIQTIVPKTLLDTMVG